MLGILIGISGWISRNIALLSVFDKNAELKLSAQLEEAFNCVQIFLDIDSWEDNENVLKILQFFLAFYWSSLKMFSLKVLSIFLQIWYPNSRSNYSLAFEAKRFATPDIRFSIPEDSPGVFLFLFASEKFCAYT